MLNKTTLEQMDIKRESKIRKYRKNVTNPEIKTEATGERVQFVKDNLDMPISKLEEKTELSRQLIATIKVAEWNDCWKGHYNLEKELTSAMKNWLVKHEKKETWAAFTKKFNQKFSLHNPTPISEPAMRKLKKKYCTGGG